MDESSEHIEPDARLPVQTPLLLHARYTRDEIMAAMGESSAERPRGIREGVFFSEGNQTDLFFVTLQKSERDFSPTTMYRDYAISPQLFHWESQSVTSEASKTGQRYINHQKMGTAVFLFIRPEKESNGRTNPYWFAGPARYVSHQGERPMAITWKLDVPLPPDLFASFKVAAA